MKYSKHSLFKRIINPYWYSFLLLGVIGQVQAQDYPFKNLPETIVATLNVATTTTEPYKNTLLGYNISRFTSADEKDLIKKFDPITIRFPQGIFSNWYDWRIDDFTFYSPWIDESHKSVVNGQPKAGVVGLQSLNNDKAQNNGLGYDFLITWNMSDDGAKGNDLNTNTESVERLKYYKTIGFDVNAIEFGNELFYRNQRSPYVPDEATFIARAKSLSRDLKAIDSNIKISIPLIFRSSATNPNWNQLIAADKSYYDAISVHKYIGVDVDNRLDLSTIGYEFGLAARLSLEPAITFARKYASDKPVWLTEWGVDVGNSPTGNAASCLGMADCYIYMAENQNIYQRANWFTANSSANQHVKLVDGTFATIEYPLKKTAYGFTYDIIRSVFENSSLLTSTVVTSTKLELIGSSVNAVSAKAVIKDGKKLILALNLTDKPAVLQINVDGSLFSGDYELEAFKFNNIADLPIIPWDQNPYNFTQNGSGTITLPPLSVNKITLKDPFEYSVKFASPLNGAKIDKGTNVIVEATAGSAVTGVSLFINDILVRNITTSPYKWGDNSILDAELKNLVPGFYNLKLVASNATTTTYFDSITIEIKDTPKQFPYKGTPAIITGTIEAEDYDKGGQNVAYNDTDVSNKGAAYRFDEGVDVGAIPTGGFSVGYVVGGEWIKYTVEVEETGKYDLTIKYSSGRTGGGTISISANDLNIVNNRTLAQTAGWNDYQTSIIKDLQLEKGIQVLKVTISGGGYNLDNLTFSRGTLSVADFETTKIVIHPNPSKNGVFTLTEPMPWEVFSFSGAKLLKGEGAKIDLSRFANGVYILKSGNASTKLVKQ